MEQKIRRSSYITIAIILVGLAVLNVLDWQSQTVGIITGIAYLFFFSHIFGSIYIAKKGWEVFFGVLFLTALVALYGAYTIFFFQFTELAYIFLIAGIPMVLFIPYYHFQPKEKFSWKKLIKDYLNRFTLRQETKLRSVLILAYALAALASAFLIFAGRTNESIQSPWEVVPPQFWPLYFLATAILVTYLFRANRVKLPLLLIIAHTLLSSGVAVIVYQVGFGFDPFIHQATERIIAATGTITPTPLYYLGQYGLIIFLQKLFFIDLEIIDRWLVPVLFSLTLPPVIFYTFSYWLQKNYALVLSLGVLVIPFGGFIMTTPQNLANLFFMITILLSLLYFRNQVHLTALCLLTLATIAIHPLAGIPLAITLGLFTLFKLMYTNYARHTSLFVVSSLVFVIALPLIFLINGSSIALQLPDINRNDLWLLSWVDRFDLPLNLVYLLNANAVVLALAVIGVGLHVITKNKLLRNNAAYLMAALVIFINFIITKYFITFPQLQLIDSVPFVGRLLTLAFYILLPFFLLGLYYLIKSFWEKDGFGQGFVILSLSGLITASVYLSYPRLDEYGPAKFFSVSASDIQTVNIIGQTAHPNHIVLANQMIGAAAIQEHGFKKYYGNQFYYAMPSGDPHTLYDGFLEMTYEGAQRATMERLMAETGVHESYFVVNKYWRDADKIVAQARQSADQVFEIDDGTVYIFKYTR